MKILRTVTSSKGTRKLYFLGIKLCSLRARIPNICVDENNEVDVPNLKYLKVRIKGKNNKVYIHHHVAPDSRIAIDVVGNNNVICLDTENLIHCNATLGLIDKPIENAVFKIGEKTSINGLNVFMVENNSQVSIGKECLFSYGIEMWCSDTHCVLDLQGNLLNVGKSIEVGNHVWVGKDVHFAKNTKIPNDCIVGWCSNVTSLFDEEHVIVAGNPAKVVKRNIQWNSMRPDEYLMSSSLQTK